MGLREMDYGVNLTYTTAVILQALASGYQYGFDIVDATGVASGTVYPALRRLEEAELVVSQWEDETAAKREQRTPRRYYELTRLGQRALADALNRYRMLETLFPATRKPKLPKLPKLLDQSS